jgi:stage V sporulation protein SpoVS
MPEEVVLKVGTHTNPAALAGAIYKNVAEGKAVVARAFGASATYTLNKALAVAQGFFRSHGKEMFCQVSTEAPVAGRDVRSVTVAFFVRDEDGMRAVPVPLCLEQALP